MVVPLLALGASFRFRPEFLKLGRTVISFGVQLVFLTATLAVRNEEWFRRLTGIDTLHSHIFRGCTTRPNIKYSVVLVDRREEVTKIVVRLVGEIIQDQPQARIMIYCCRTSEVDSPAEELGCHSYHAQIDNGNAERKEKWMEQWVSSGGAIVATNALGVGLYVADVRYVFHLDPRVTYGTSCRKAGELDEMVWRASPYLSHSGYRQQGKRRQASYDTRTLRSYGRSSSRQILPIIYRQRPGAGAYTWTV